MAELHNPADFDIFVHEIGEMVLAGARIEIDDEAARRIRSSFLHVDGAPASAQPAPVVEPVVDPAGVSGSPEVPAGASNAPAQPGVSPLTPSAEGGQPPVAPAKSDTDPKLAPLDGPPPVASGPAVAGVSEPAASATSEPGVTDPKAPAADGVNAAPAGAPAAAPPAGS